MHTEATKQLRQVRGTVVGFNVSGKGKIVGALVETLDGTEQVNFPKRDAYLLARSMPVGAKIDVRAELESATDGHRVFFVVAPVGTVSGKVVRLNHARDGRVNGYHLDDGTYLHVKSSDARELTIRVGEKVRATGLRRDGHETVVFAVRTLERIGKRRDLALAPVTT